MLKFIFDYMNYQSGKRIIEKYFKIYDDESILIKVEKGYKINPKRILTEKVRYNVQNASMKMASWEERKNKWKKRLEKILK